MGDAQRNEYEQPAEGKGKRRTKKKRNSLTKREDHRVCMNTPRFDKEELRTWRKNEKERNSLTKRGENEKDNGCVSE